MIDGNEWKWPIEWDDRFDVITKVPIPRLDTDIKDKTVWVDKNGKEKTFSVKEAWRAIRDDYPKVIWSLVAAWVLWLSVLMAGLKLMLVGLELVYGDGLMGVWLVSGFFDDSEYSLFLQLDVLTLYVFSFL
ncbi:hypothetical protein Tco_0073181 [Tanacetum coccineum]